MAKQSTRTATKTPKGKGTAPPEPSAPMDGAAAVPEAPGTAVPADGELPPAAAGGTAAPEIPENGLETAPEEAGRCEAQAAPEELPTPAGRRAAVRSPKGLNLRMGPSLSYDVLEVLPDGTEVTVLDLPEGVTVPGWELAHTGERAGWAAARFLRPLEG